MRTASFRPNGDITRAEFATIAARFFDVTYNGKDLSPDISGHWAKDYINQAANKGFVNGYEDGTFKPDRDITRAEAVTLVNRTLDRRPDKNHFTKDMLVWPDNMDQTKWYYADMQEATNSHTYQMKENSDKTKYENSDQETLPIRNWGGPGEGVVQRQLFPGERERGVRTASREARHSFVPKTCGGGPNGVPLLTISDAMKVTLYEFSPPAPPGGASEAVGPGQTSPPRPRT